MRPAITAKAGWCARADARQVLSILVEKGAKVVRGQRLAIIEAMKMEHTLTAPIDGVVADIAATANAQVPEGARLMLIEPAAKTPV